MHRYSLSLAFGTSPRTPIRCPDFPSLKRLSRTWLRTPVSSPCSTRRCTRFAPSYRLGLILANSYTHEPPVELARRSCSQLGIQPRCHQPPGRGPVAPLGDRLEPQLL